MVLRGSIAKGLLATGLLATGMLVLAPLSQATAGTPGIAGLLGSARSISFSGSPQQLSKVHYSQTNAILQELTTAKTATRDAQMSSWLDQLGTIYASMTGEAIWTDTNGYTHRATTLINELKNAREWGLHTYTYAVPTYAPGQLSTQTLAKMEVGLSLALIKYAWHARGGRIKPTDLSLWLDRDAKPIDAIATIKSLSLSPDPRAQLLKFHPQHEQFERLRQAYLTLLYPDKYKKKATRADIRVPARGPKLRPGAKHPDIAIIRHRLGVLAIRRDAEVYSPELVAAVNRYMRKQGWKRKRIVDNKVRTALNNPKQNRINKLNKSAKIALLLVNMEKWRWVPDDLGPLYIWNNLPEYRTRVVKSGSVIHNERIIIGKLDSQTPVFSDEMTHVVFKPQWGIPNSIKIRSLLPRLAGGDYGVLARRGMSIKYDNGVTKHPSRFNWSKTDIRSIPIVMGPGSSNPLGQVKFIFPNHHSVYMHDTPNKGLFGSKTRTFSHGCIRVRNPKRLAEVLMSETSGWGADLVASHMTRSSPGNNKVPLPSPIPVHNVYFTVVVDEATGKLARLDDVYSHDKRITDALNGKSVKRIAASDPARAQIRKNEQLAKSPGIVYARKARRRRPAGAMALGAFSTLPPPTTFWGKPKKWKTWSAKPKPARATTKKRRRHRRRARGRAVRINPFQVYY